MKANPPDSLEALGDLSFGDRPEIADLPPVTIAIPCFRNHDIVRLCLEALSRNTGPTEYELLLLNDDPADLQMPAVFKEFAAKIQNLEVVPNYSNGGVVLANNKMIEASSSGFVVFMNADVIVTRDWLPKLLAPLIRNGWDAAGCCLTFPNGSVQHVGVAYGTESPAAFPENENIFPYLPYHPLMEEPLREIKLPEPRRVAGVTTALAVFKREILFAVGCFDETYSPGYYDDPDLCLALLRAGYAVGLSSNCVAFHLGNQSFRSLGSARRALLERNGRYFLKKWEPWLSDHVRPRFDSDPVWGDF